MRAWIAGLAGLLLAAGPAVGQDEADPESEEAAAEDQAQYEEPAFDESAPADDFGEAASGETTAEQSNPFAELDWIVGPTDVKVGGQATLGVPEGFLYLNPDEATKFQELTQNPTGGRESLIAPDDLRWFGLLVFDDVGYVKDDDDIDADDLLKSIKEGNDAGNEERRKKGWPALDITGWRFKPRYDSSTQRLEWAINAVSENVPVVNFNTRLLGRRGVTSAILVADPESLDVAVAEFKDVLTGFDYNSGERYADVQEGDHMAEYGLAALIAGGGAAVAAKSGLLKGLWKFLAAAGVAVAAWFAKMFKGKKQQDA